MSALLSLLLPGTGQVYCGQDNKGIFLLGMALLGHWCTGGQTDWLLCPAAALDAFLIARKRNSGRLLARWEFFPALRPLNAIPPRLIVVSIILFLATLTVLRVVHFAAD